jgi:hypothetical protein
MLAYDSSLAQKAQGPQTSRARNPLKTMEPMSGLEPLTYALRMGTSRKTEMIAKKIVSYLATDWGASKVSRARRFVSQKDTKPDLY